MIYDALNLLLQSTLLLSVGLLTARLSGTSAAFRHLILASVGGWLLVLPWLPDVASVAVPAVSLPQIDLAWIEESVAAQPGAVSRAAAFEWSPLTAAVVVYGGVIALLAARFLLDVLRVSRLVRRGQRLSRDPDGTPLVQLTEAQVSPFVWGLLRPCIVLPSGAQSWSPERMRMVIGHEQAHLDRGDIWTALLARLVCWLYWWHPLVWIARRRLVELAEQACDDAVLLDGASPEGYAQALIDITRTTRPQVTPAMASATHLAQRVNALLDYKVRRTQMSIYRIVITVTLSALCFFPAGRLSVAAGQTAPALDAETHASLTDVQQLIAREELAAASAQLDSMLEREGLSPNAVAQVQNMRGYVAFLREDYAAAIDRYQQVIVQPEMIPVGLHQTTLYTLAQLHFVQDDYAEAIRHMHLWAELAETPGPIPLVFIAQNYYQMEDYEAALDYIERGLVEAEARGVSAKPNWIKLRDYLRVQTGAEPDLGDIDRDFLKPARDSELMPIAKVQPVYPEQAKTNRIEGYVLVEFTVTSSGSVSNPLVVEAQPPGVFDAAALAAVRKFRYKPRLADGVPVDTTGIRNRITFALGEDSAG